MKTIVINPTNYCNFACLHCGIKKLNKKNYISIFRVKKILKLARKQNFRKVVITGGGEPSIYFDRLLEIIKIAKKHKFHVKLVTNVSFMLNKKRNSIKELKGAGLNRLSISVGTYHLKFIPYDLILKAIKQSLKEKINLRIKICFTRKTKKENLFILKRIAKDLNGRLIKLLPNTPLHYRTVYALFVKNQIISAIVFGAVRTENNKTKPINFRKINLKLLAFLRCTYRAPVINENGDIIPCCSSHSINNSNLYKMNNINRLNKKDDKINNYSWLMKQIFFDRFGFLKFYLKFKKDKKLKKLLKRNFYSECDFCTLIFKNKQRLEKLPDPSKLEIIKFMLGNLRYLHVGLLQRLIFVFIGIILEL